MDSRTRGKMQALLAGLEFPNTRESLNIHKMDSDIKLLMERLNTYMKSAGGLAREFQEVNAMVDQLKSELSVSQSVLDEERAKVHKLQVECERLKDLEGELEKSKAAVEAARSENKSSKASIEELTESLQQRDVTIQSMNQRLSDKDSNIEALQNTVKQHVEKGDRLLSELDNERKSTADLQTQIESLKSDHLQQMEELKVQMGEKVLRAQARITQQAGTSAAGSALSSNELRDIFKKKLANTESTHQKELTELKKTISRLQQQLRGK